MTIDSALLALCQSLACGALYDSALQRDVDTDDRAEEPNLGCDAATGLLQEVITSLVQLGLWRNGAAEKQQTEKPGSELAEAVRAWIDADDAFKKAIETTDVVLCQVLASARSRQLDALRTALAKHDAAEKAGEGG